MNDLMQKLEFLKNYNGGQRNTTGLQQDTITAFLNSDPKLGEAIERASLMHQCLREQFEDILKKNEDEQISELQKGYLNFYDPDTVNPYVPLAACGPWIITSCGAVVHDSGGYGMLGFGHNPKPLQPALGAEQVMANVMTASFSQKRFMTKLRSQIGITHSDSKCPYDQFLCLNSGSEAMSVAMRISDLNAKTQTDPGARHHNKKICILSNQGSFHGRTDRPANASDSTAGKYELLASFRDRKNLITTPPNDIEQLTQTFAKAAQDGVFIESFLLEPVMGEGKPGVPMTPEYYQLARKLVHDQGGLIIVDAIQAGIRTHGYLSVTDYPGFQNLPAPDMESYSKALNAGQYPLSVLAMNQDTATIYKTGLYGNTMTTNPRALDVASSVLDMLTEQVRSNIQKRGVEFKEKLKKLQTELDGPITGVEGTGLLFAADLDPKVYCAAGPNSVETYLRKKGLGVIHGGANALRFTPHFLINSQEADMIIEQVKEALIHGPKL
jgi:acetylornithine/succinyldiaminopimelate/putrescine aminotransferase